MDIPCIYLHYFFIFSQSLLSINNCLHLHIVKNDKINLYGLNFNDSINVNQLINWRRGWGGGVGGGEGGGGCEILVIRSLRQIGN